MANSKKKIRILYLISEFPLISENFIIYEINGLLQKEADIEIVSLSRPSTEKHSKIPDDLGFSDHISYRPGLLNNRILRLAKLSFLMLRLLVRGQSNSFIKLLKDNQTAAEYSRYILLETARSLEKAQSDTDILFCHFGPSGRLGAILKEYGLVTAKLVTTFHGYDISSYVKDKPGIYDLLFKNGDLFISVSDFFRKKVCTLGAPEKKSTVVHTAINMNQFSFIPRQRPQAAEIRFICVGRMTEKKGHEYLIRAFARLCHEHSEYSVHLDLIGGGELTESIQDLIAEMNVLDFVTCHGPLQHKEVREKLAEGHIFVLPSITAANGDTEGIPGALMEAMAQGLPVIATYHTGTPELIEHEKTGLLCEERDVEGLYRAMLKLIETPDIWDDLTKAARQKVEADFERQKETDKLYRLLESLIN